MTEETADGSFRYSAFPALDVKDRVNKHGGGV